MGIHAAVMASLFAGQVVQAPSVPLDWRQWIPTGVSILSIGIGVWLADRSIRKARDLTEWSFRATSERDRERWVLDQKKAEWKEILVKVAAIEEIIPCIATGLPDYEPLNDSVLAVLPHLRGNIFIYGALKSSGFIGKWESYAGFASGIVDTIKGDDTVQEEPHELLNPGDKEGSRQSRKAYERTVRMKLHELREELRTLAQKELGI
jgi:hypothetical protein